jgi:hypothetical protein
MKCNDFDARIDEMLSGILHPDASQHMSQCERCTSHFRARSSVQIALCTLASASPSGPSRATDRAVMESYRRLQQSRHTAAHDADEMEPAPTARLFAFPGRSLAPVWVSRTWWTGAAAAAVVLAVFGSAVHLWTGVPTVSAPTVAEQTQPSTQSQPATAPVSSGPVIVARKSAADTTPRRPSHLSRSSESASPQTEVASAPPIRVEPSEQVLTATATPVRSAAVYEGAGYDSSPVTHLATSAPPVVRLASSGAAGSVAQSASSTWPGYSNLMYCDPVVCSGPMQVVHIKVPVGQVKPNLGQTVGNAFVNAEVVVGPDGVARAIRVAN